MIRYAAPFAIFAFAFLASCNGPDRTPSEDVSNVATQAIQDDVAGIEQNVRLAAANKRIDALQAEVAALKVNPQTIEVALLKQRLEAVETAVYARGDDRPDQAAAAGKDTPPVIATKPKPARQAPLEARPARPATKGEQEAFAKGG